MFLKKYLNNNDYQTLLNTYQYEYLTTIDEKQFKKIYNLFLKYNFTYIEDIILRYITLFTLDEKYMEKGLLNIIKKLGPNYLNIISTDLTYLNELENYL